MTQGGGDLTPGARIWKGGESTPFPYAPEDIGLDPGKPGIAGRIGNAAYRVFIKPNWQDKAEAKYYGGGYDLQPGPDAMHSGPRMPGYGTPQPGHLAEGRLPSFPKLPHTRVPNVEEMREYLHPFDNDVRYSGMPVGDAGESGVSSVEDMRGMFRGTPGAQGFVGGAAIYTPDGKGGGTIRPVVDYSRPPPILPRATPGDNPFARSGDTVAAIQDPMARRFDALSPEDKGRLIRLGDGMKSGKVPQEVYAQEAQRLMIDENPYGPRGSLPGEAGFFPPKPGPSPLAENMKFYAGKIGTAVDLAGVLNQISQTNRAISGAPRYAQGPMTLGTMGTVGTAAGAAGAAATGLPVAGVLGIGLAGAAVPMGIATTFGAASGQEGSDPWGGRKPYGVGVAGPKKTSMGDTISAGPIVGTAGRDDELDHFDIGHAHGVLVGKQIKTQITKAFETFQSDLHKHIQNGGVQP